MNTKISRKIIHVGRFVALSTLLSICSVQAETTYSGRAYAASVDTVLTDPIYISDTGELPASGGFRSESLLTTRGTAVEGLILADVLNGSTSGSSGRAQSSASVADVTLLPGNAAQVTASFVRSETSADCQGMQGTSEIVELTFGGQTIAVSGAPNQTVAIPGVATLIINEQTMTSSGTYREIKVNALHLIVPGVAEIVVASAKSDINCVPPTPPGPCHDFVTGGGFLKEGNSRANFGFNAGFKHDAVMPVAHLNYIDHSAGLKVKVSSITLYEANSPTGRHFEGTCEINGAPGTYSVDVSDQGEPGRNDTFSIRLSSGYARAGTLSGGNIQLHHPCD